MHDEATEAILDEEARAAGVTAVPLNEAASATAGLLVRIPPGVVLERPVRIVTTLDETTSSLAVRLVVLVGEGASATVVEETHGPQSEGLANFDELTELHAGSGCRVRFVLFQDLGRGVVAHRTYRARLEREASVTTTIASLGAAADKADIGAILAGEGAESRMTGLYLGGGRQRSTHHTLQDHVSGRTSSNIDFRVVLSGRARSAYSGLVRIARDAPACEAYQENRNLLLSDQCQATSIPELEILTDEVQCKHGATVGPIDPEQLFYLGSRGLDPQEATRMIVSGFLEQTLADLPEETRASIGDGMTRRLEEGLR